MDLLEFLMELDILDQIFYRSIFYRSGITHVIFHNDAKINVDKYDSLPLEKTLTFHNVIIHIKSVWNKDPNNCYYNILLEKYSYELPKDNDDNKYFLFNKSIDVNNTNESKECDICHYWYFLDKRFNRMSAMVVMMY